MKLGLSVTVHTPNMIPFVSLLEFTHSIIKRTGTTQVLSCLGPLICTFPLIHLEVFWSFATIWRKNFLWSSLPLCKNTVYNTYNIQNVLINYYVIGKLLVNSKLLIVKLLGSQNLYMDFVWGVGTPIPELIKSSKVLEGPGPRGTCLA